MLAAGGSPFDSLLGRLHAIPAVEREIEQVRRTSKFFNSFQVHSLLVDVFSGGGADGGKSTCWTSSVSLGRNSGCNRPSVRRTPH